MKKIVLMMAVVASIAFTSQSVQAMPTVAGVEVVNQDEFVKIELSELPGAVTKAVLEANEGATIKEAYVAGAEAEKKFKVVITNQAGEEATLLLSENGEYIS